MPLNMNNFGRISLKIFKRIDKMEKYIFALDIGTRSVIGFLLKEDGEYFNFVDIESLEHQERTMLNGQIHDAPMVSRVISQVKKNLEERNNIEIRKTSVAAAGRSLITRKEFIEESFPSEKLIDKDDISRLKFKCVHKAQQALKLDSEKKEFSNYYCVGYSVTRSFLDGVELVNLEGQRGSKIGVEIVAAFLPKMVLDALKFVVEDNKLILENLTLEPIAAINAIIPPTMRKLNLALVDIGAGTSDIAISSEGSINAYGMVAMAGDEVSEKISEDFLLDFNEAERVKRLIAQEEEIEYTDVLAMTHAVAKDDLMASLESVSSQLALKIVNEILSLNGKAPQAVILIGGGSLTPGIAKKIANNLEIAENRVAVQTTRSIKNILNLPDKYQGPEYITPAGIALTAGHDSNLGFIQLMVNDQPISILNLGVNTVFDALLAAGIPANQVFPMPGRPKTIKINGKLRIVQGGPPKPAQVFINDEKARPDDLVGENDFIDFIAGEEGQPARARLSEYLPPEKKIFINSEEYLVPYNLLLDGARVNDFNQELADNSNIQFDQPLSLGEILSTIKEDYLEKADYNISINDSLRFKTIYKYDFYHKGLPLDLNHQIENGQRLEIRERDSQDFKLANILKDDLGLLDRRSINVTMDGQPVRLIVSDYEILHNNSLANLNDYIKDGDYINISKKEIKEPVLIDVFKEINFIPKAPAGMSKIDIYLNDQDAEYISPIKDGDVIRIVWS